MSSPQRRRKRIHRTTKAGTEYAFSSSGKPSAKLLAAMDDLADVARQYLEMGEGHHADTR